MELNKDYRVMLLMRAHDVLNSETGIDLPPWNWSLSLLDFKDNAANIIIRGELWAREFKFAPAAEQYDEEVGKTMEAATKVLEDYKKNSSITEFLKNRATRCELKILQQEKQVQVVVENTVELKDVAVMKPEVIQNLSALLEAVHYLHVIPQVEVDPGIMPLEIIEQVEKILLTIPAVPPKEETK